MPPIDVRGRSLMYDDGGDGEVVLCIHGFPFNRSMWDEARLALASRYRVLSPDLRGFGESSGSESWTLDDQANDLIELLDHLAIDRVAVLGLSMGGYIALNLARRYPERLWAMVLIDTKATSDNYDAKQNRLKTAETALREGAAPIAAQMLPKLLSPANAEDQRLIERLNGMMLTTNPKTIASAAHAMASRPDSTPYLSTMALPSLVIVGNDDQITTPNDAHAMVAALPHASLVTIPDAGHMSVLEQPEITYGAIRVFLDQAQQG
ncbi:alpha/beta fold hydrolase [Herpetosiphon gulosus]|uniref:3-oxoadipate enol-lactonase 2 n=1 Tax=Herpetosiphon gulosus TaxID=1973496 RepID=A0ABP9X2Z9_9CHLR